MIKRLIKRAKNTLRRTGGRAAPNIRIKPQDASAIREALAGLMRRFPNEALGQANAPEVGEKATEEQAACGGSFESETQLSIIEILPILAGELPVNMHALNTLPGYTQEAIQAMGREIFRSFPCFRDFEEKCRAQGINALGEVLTTSDFIEGGAHTSNVLMKLIIKHGQKIQHGQMSHDLFLSGYSPDIIVFATDKWTFKLVHDSPENGAPFDAYYVYAWPGGRNFYKANPLALPPARSVMLPEVAAAHTEPNG